MQSTDVNRNSQIIQVTQVMVMTVSNVMRVLCHNGIYASDLDSPVIGQSIFGLSYLSWLYPSYSFNFSLLNTGLFFFTVF